MSKGKMKSRLAAQLAAAAVCSAVAAFLLFAALQQGAYRALENYLLKEDVAHRMEESCVARLQEYVTENRLQMKQAEEIGTWVNSKPNILLFIFNQDRLIYTNTKMPAMEPDESYGSPAGETEPDVPDEFSWTYELRFVDGTAGVDLYYYFENYYYMAANAICGALAFILFVSLLLILIRKKIKYISLLERELRILGGGDLDYTVTVKGNDELSSLAEGINDMRCAIKERMEKEEEAKRANRELVTAMSHDLRTPLTSLLGYVDILNIDTEMDEQQKARYLDAIRRKAYQIKEMSDKLFEYFIVYGTEEETLETEEVNGREFINQIVEESLFDMESEGFAIIRESDEIHCSLLADVKLVRRVFGNVFSNLLKYGDRRQPISVEYRQRGQELMICFVNSVNREAAKCESSGMGLKTCRKIMESHGGSFKSSLEGERFIVEIRFQISG